MSEHDIVTVGRTLPKLASVEPANGPFSVSVTWALGARVGRTDVVDLAPMIFTFKVFRPLRDGGVQFNSVRLGEWGASIVWDGNDDLDIGAESIEEMADEVMTNADFSAFLKRNSLTLDAAAAQLGIARRLVAYYAKEREIPRTVALACRYLDLTLAEAPPEPTTKEWAEAFDVCLVPYGHKPRNLVVMDTCALTEAGRSVLMHTVRAPFHPHQADLGAVKHYSKAGLRGLAGSWTAGDPLPADFFTASKQEKRGG